MSDLYDAIAVFGITLGLLLLAGWLEQGGKSKDEDYDDE